MSQPQGNLFEQPISPKISPLVPIEYGPGLTLEDRWKQFHRLNPDVYEKLRLVSLDMRRRGIRHWGIGAVFERLRWLYKFQTQGDDYKLNNSWRAFYARLLMEREAELEGFFELRIQKSLE